MSSTYGEHLKLSIFGQSHAPAIGMTLDGVPAGQAIDLDELQRFLDRRAPGRAEYATPRKEADRPEFLSGLVGNVTCGAPLAAIIRNTNTRSGDYSNLAVVPRPGHADYTAAVKYGGAQDAAGGGVLGKAPGIAIFPEEFGIKVLTLPVGGFLTLGCLIALMQWALAKSAKKKEAK